MNKNDKLFQRGYQEATRLLSPIPDQVSDSTENQLVQAKAQKTIAQHDPYPCAFTRGWIAACDETINKLKTKATDARPI